MIVTRGFGIGTYITIVTRGYVRTAYYIEVIRLDSGIVLQIDVQTELITSVVIESETVTQIDLSSPIEFQVGLDSELVQQIDLSSPLDFEEHV